MTILAYADQFRAAPGDTLRFMVSSSAEYDAEVVRLVHGDDAPTGPGFVAEHVATTVSGTYPGRHQDVYPGSYVRVADAPALHPAGSFALRLWVYPTTLGRPLQGLFAKWDDETGCGYALVLMDGKPALWLGDGSGPVQRVASGEALCEREWTLVTAEVNVERSEVVLCALPLHAWAGPTVESTEPLERPPAASATPLLFGAVWIDGGAAHGFFNGKLEGPRLEHGDAVAAWDFGVREDLRSVPDTGPHGLHGETAQMPMRAVTGHNWSGRELSHRAAAGEYGAIHFHEDDLEDAGWEPDFELVVPELASGVYGAHLRCQGAETYVPFVVRPPRGRCTADIAVVLPTLTYLAYANERQFWHSDGLWFPGTPSGSELESLMAGHPEIGLSLYDAHADGSGCCYSSRLRPIPNMSPRYRYWLTGSPRHLAGDLYLVDWLRHKGFRFDVLTDEDLHEEGAELLGRYRVVLTGSHPEYVTEAMLDATETYLSGGGRLMYLGGNGYYWVTSVDPGRRHVIEVRRGASGSRSWESAPGEAFHSTTGEPGGTWRHRGRPPQRLVGVGFGAQGWDRGCGYIREPGSFRAEVAFVFEGVGEDEVIGDFGLALGAAAADELDRVDELLGTPPHAIRLASAGALSDYYQLALEDVVGTGPGTGGTENEKVRADMVYVPWPNRGAVFSVGSVAWTGSLSHDGYDNNVSRVTENVLRRFLAA
jgi:N,N-dimethylformamidase